ncbi:T1SS-143 domain-containing protein, partial [Rhizobium mesoamericanum]|uniref:VCBS domain-containing protein n=1 Tax=Rhizobium mesoamericanum TaxID=1079800 RepID=UPI0027805C4B
MSIEDPRISAISSENVSHDFRQDIHEDASIEASAQQGVEVAQAENSQQPGKTDRLPGAPQTVAANAHPAEIVPDQHNVAHLPADVSIDDIRVEGNNLVLVQADGTEIVIVNGALHVPTFLLGEVELPQQAVIAALEQSNINVAAGPDGSYTASASAPGSGADFQDTMQQDPNDPIQLAQLLADTQQPDPGLGGRQDLFDDQPTISDTLTLSLTETEGQGGGFETQSVNGTFGFNGGADIGQITAVQLVDSLNMDEGTQNGSHLDLTSDGKPVVITINGLTITGSVDGHPVFVLTVTNAATGAFTFTQFGPLDHPDKGQAGIDDVLRLQFSYTVTDKDGDQATGVASININDDGPSTGEGIGQSAINESDLLSGEGGNAKVEDVSLGIHWGADAGEHRDLTFASAQDQLSGLTSHGQTIQFEISADGHTLTGFIQSDETRTDVFVVTLDPKAANGAYSFTLLQPLDHPQTSETGNTQLDLRFNFVASDADGDTANGSFTVDVNDDLPTAGSSGPATVTEAGDAEGAFVTQTATGNLVFSQGADGAEVTNIAYHVDPTLEKQGEEIGSHALTSNGQAITVSTSADGLTVTGKVGDVTIFTLQVTDAKTGAYTFTQTGPIDHPDKNETGASDTLRITFDFTVTDGDGDTASNAVHIDINDDGPSTGEGIGQSAINESDLLSGEGGNAKVEDVSLGIHWGADAGEHRDLTFASAQDQLSGLTSHGQTIQFEISADGHTLTGFIQSDETRTNVFVVTLDPKAANGAYSFTLLQPLDHPQTSETGNTQLDLRFNFVASDADGDTANGSFTVDLNDDVPTVNGSNQQVNLLANGNFAAGAWEQHSDWGGSLGGAANSDIGWKVDGTDTIQLERVGSGYLGMTTSNGAPMVDMGSSPGNTTISQDIAGLAAGQDYKLSFQAGSPNPASSGLEVYWNGKLVYSYSPTFAMKSIDLDLMAIDGTNTLTFKEVGNRSDNTGTYLANVSLTANTSPPVLTGTAGEDDVMSFTLAPGSQFSYGADGAGNVMLGAATVASAAGIPLTLHAGDYFYQNGAIVIKAGVFNALNAGEIATVTVPFTVTDADGDTKSGVYQIQVTGANDVASISGIAAGAVVEDGALQANGLISVADVDHGENHFQTPSSLAGQYGNFSFDPATGAWNYTLNNGLAQSLGKGVHFNETLTVTSADGTATQTITVTVNGTNDAPQLSAITGWTFKDTAADDTFSPVVGQLQSSDVDLGDSATYGIGGTGVVTGAFTGGYNIEKVGTYGTLYLNSATGAYTYVPNDGAIEALKKGATESFTLTVTDGAGAGDSKTLTITLDGTNDTPVAVADTNAVKEAGFGTFGDWKAEGNVLSNDADRDAGDTKIVSDLKDANGHGFGVFVKVGHYGILELNKNGSYAYILNNFDKDTNRLAQGETAHETFTYTVRDASGATSTTTLTIEITGTNDAPSASFHYNTVEEGISTADSSVATGNLLYGASDVDHGAVLTVAGVDGQSSGSTGAAGDYGNLTWDASTGTYSYVLDNTKASVQALAAGEVRYETFVYTINDEWGATDTKTLTIEVIGTNDAPVITGGDTGATVIEAGAGNNGAAVESGTLYKTDVDSDDNNSNDIWSVVASGSQMQDGSSVKGVYGTLSVDQAGKWTYTLDNSLTATQALKDGDSKLETFTIQVMDSHGATDTQIVNITVRGTNDAPVANDDTFMASEDGVSSHTSSANPLIVGNVLANDSDVDSASLSVIGVSNVSLNTAAGSGLTLSVSYEGNEVYKITTNFGDAHLSVGSNGDVRLWSDSGEDPFNALGVNETTTIKFDYTISDDNGGTASATATITVQGSNDSPVAVDDPATYSDDFSNPSGWTFINLSGTPTWSTSGGNLGEQSNDGRGIALAPTGSLPAYSKVYTVEVDGDPNTSGNGNSKSNQALGVVFGYQDPTHYYRVYWKDFGTDFSPDHGSSRELVLEKVDGNQVTVLSDGGKVNLGSDTVHFKVDVDSNGIEVTVTGSNGQTVVLHSSDVPALGGYGVYTDDNENGIAYDNFTASSGRAITTAEDTALVINAANLLANDSDVDGDTLSIAGVSTTSAHGGTVTLNNNGTITYNPAANYNGKDTFTYTVSDGHGGTATATVTVNVTPVNDPAVLSPAVVNKTEGDTATAISASGKLTITDVDSPSTFVAQTNVAGSNGYGKFSIDVNGNWTYTANSAHDEFKAGQTFTDSFTVTSADGTTTTVTVNIAGTNDAPQTNAASGSGNEDASSISVALSGSDVDGSVASF